MADAKHLDAEEQDLLKRSAPAPVEATPPAKESPPTQGLGSIATGAILYGARKEQETFGLGAHNLVEGLNDMIALDEPVEQLRRKWRGAGKILSGLFQMGLAPLTLPAAALRKAVKDLAPELEQHDIANGLGAAAVRGLLDPFGAIGALGDVGSDKPEAQARLKQKAEELTGAFTFGDAVELGVQLAIPVMMSQMKGKKGAKGKKGEAPAAAKEGEAASTTPTPSAPETPAKVGGKELQPVTDEQARAFADKMAQEEPVPPAGTQGPRVFGVNWQRLGQEEAVNRAILLINRDLAEQGQMPMREGAVKPTTASDIAARATQLGVTLEDVMKLPDLPERVRSVEDLDAFTTGVRGVRDVIANRLSAEARMAVAGDAAARENVKPLIALATQAAMADKLTGENIAQALQSRSNLSAAETSGTSTMRLMELVQRLSGMSDIDKAAEMITKLTTKEPRTRFLENLGEAAKRGKDIVWELYVNSLLSGPRTVVKKVLSDALRATWEIPERAIGRMNHVLFFPEDPLGVAPGEAKAMARGLGAGIADGIRYAGHEDVDLGTGLGESHTFPKALSAENLGLEPGSGVGRAVDTLGNIVRMPGTVIGVATKGAQIASYQMELRAQAVRQAWWEGRTGRDFTDRVQYVESHSGEFPMVADNASQAALVNTFTQELGPAGKAILGALNAVHLRGQVPFVKIPWNLVKFGVQTIPPFNFPSLLWGELNQAIKAGGASRELALAQVQMGAAVTAMVAYYVGNGQITGGGPHDASLRETRRALGIPPYSIKIADTWYRYNIVEPVGGMIGLTADLGEVWAQLPADGEMADRVYQTGAAIAIAAGRTMSEKPFFTGIRDVIEAIEKPDQRANTLAKGWARSMIPTLVRVTNQAYFDRTMREVRGPLDQLKASTPGYSQTLPPHRNPITGVPVEFPPALGPDIASPITQVEEKPDPVFQMLLDNQIKVRAIPWVIDGHAPPAVAMTEAQANAGIRLTPQQRDQWVLLMTQEPLNGKTLYGALEGLMQTPRFQYASTGPLGGKEALVQETVHLYREAARIRLLREDSDLRLTLMNRQREHQRLRLLPTTDPRSPQFQGGALSIGR